ncbi:hypothetical protein ACSVDA_00760 [Cytobacillus sp. Hm23]
MHNDIRATLNYFIYDFRFTISIFWVVLCSSLVVLSIASLSLDSIVRINTSLAVYIYAAIAGFSITKEIFPNCIKMGATRNNYIIAASFFAILFAIFMSAMNLLVSFIFQLITTAPELSNLAIFYTLDATTLSFTWFNHFFIDFVICLFIISVGFFSSAIFYRFGLIGGFVNLALLGIFILIPNVRDLFIDFVMSIEERTIELNFGAVTIVVITFIFLTWLVLRRASLVQSVSR